MNKGVRPVTMVNSSEATIRQIADSIIMNAFAAGATAVCIMPANDFYFVSSFDGSGILSTDRLRYVIGQACVCRLKLVASMRISVKDIPQSGKYKGSRALPAFTARTFQTKIGEAIMVSF